MERLARSPLSCLIEAKARPNLHPPAMSKHKLDLHDIYNKGSQIDDALREAMEFCIDRRIDMLEIIPGKGSGQLKKKVLRFLQLPEVKKTYHRIDKDSDNFGRLFVRFKH